MGGGRGPAVLRGQRCAACLVLSLVVVSPSPAQEAEPYRETVDVEVVEIDVMVTDRRGRPVRGLERDDFELTVDGRPVEISNFADFRTYGATRQSAEPDAAVEGPSPLTIVLYLDVPNTYAQHRERLLRRLEEAVEPWRRLNALFMLAALDDRMEILVPPTRDLDVVLAAAFGRSAGSARGGRPRGDRTRAIESLLKFDEDCADAPFCSPCEDNWGELMASARAFAYSESSRVAASLDGLGDLVTTLAGVSGRKAIVHVNSGLPQRPGESVFTYLVEQVCPAINSTIMRNHNDARGAMMGFNLASRFNLVSAHANANRVTIFSFDAAGIRALSGANVSSQIGRTALGGRRQPSPSNHALYADNAQQGLFLLADETGGKALFNSNDAVDLLGDVAEEVSHTYSLGFPLNDRRPEQVRQVEVRLAGGKGKGKRVRYRRSFRDKTLEERLAERLLSLAYLGGEEDPLSVDVGFAPSGEVRRKLHGLIVEVAVPADSVTLLPRPDSGERQGRLRLWLLAVDEDKGARTTVRQTGARVGAGGVPAISGAYRFEVDVAIPEGTYRVAVGVRDETTGVMSLIREDVTVPMAPPE